MLPLRHHAALRSVIRFIRPAFPHVRVSPFQGLVAQRKKFSSQTWPQSKQEETSINEPKDGPDDPAEKKQKASRSLASKTSLRRVALAAERSREGIIRRKGKDMFIAPDVEKMVVTAYCAADQYDPSKVADLLRKDGYQLDPCRTGLYPGVVHVQTSKIASRNGADPSVFGDIFVFPETGSVVTWNVSSRVAFHLLNNVLPGALPNPKARLSEHEVEDLDYLEDPTQEKSSIVGDTILLGTKVATQGLHSRDPTSTSSDGSAVYQNPPPGHEADTVLIKMSFSSGLARSTKLAVLERILSSYFDWIQSITTALSRSSRLPFTRKVVLRKIGELLTIRAQLNLYSELTDRSPDLFWDSRYELGLEGYYDKIGNALDVNSRIKQLNERMDYAQEIATVLREQLSEEHGTFLEQLIIFLILVEVIFETYHIVKESYEKWDPDGTENLLREYLLHELRREDVGQADKSSDL
ncbi:hypothetical protein BDY21DRAFT_338172 [Lineolata rhizophorae]|uniref:DUF155 domain-containing protein n=1 Tax=Lineolata rhizophorae TaxID=578093 RepID=A0A6A6P5Y1_9PEZI|nr:hypothetical protein BDY21DRAFT_338172 [Lineolata rhizophorae]